MTNQISPNSNQWSKFKHLTDDPEELFIVLRSLSEGPGQRVPPRRMLLGQPPRFEVGYSSKGDPFVGFCGTATTDDVRDVVKACESALQTVPMWFSFAMAVHARFDGSAEYPTLRIRPVPGSGRWLSEVRSEPREETNPLDWQPRLNAVVVDVRYDSSTEPFLRTVKRERAMNAAQALVSLGCWPLPTRIWVPRERQKWALVWDTTSDTMSNARVDLGFHLPELDTTERAQLLPLATTSTLPLVEHERFVKGPMDLEPRGALHVAESLGRMVAAFNKLRGIELRRAHRALHWFSTALGTPSPTLAVTAYAAAIEALLPENDDEGACEGCKAPTSTARCEVCELPVHKTNQSFRAFLQKYAGTALRDDFLKTIYSARSQLVHGAKVYEVDEPIFGVISTEMIDALAAQIAVRAALINWLLEERPSS